MLKKINVLILLILLPGCATLQLNDLFQGYTQQMQPVRQAVLQGNYSLAEKNVGNKPQSHTSYILSVLEKGRLSFLAKDYQQSKQWFALAYKELEQQRAQAKVSISSGVEKFGALVTNDSAIKYQVPAYEQSMMHTYQALNYLYLGDLEGALVEIRRANLVQEQALVAHEDVLNEANSELGSAQVNWQQVNAAFSSLDNRIGDVKNGFQNAYTFYLSALLYEAAGQTNDAYIDYKRALEIFADNHFIQQDVMRLAHQLSMTDDIDFFEKKFGQFNRVQQQNEGNVVVIYEQGLIDERIEKGINLPIFTRHDDFRTFNLALPSYSANTLPEQPLVLNVNNESISSEQVVQLQALVAMQLKEQMPSIIARQVLRLLAKERVRHKLSKEGGDVGNILAGLYNIASERADTRSWLTLPRDVQILKTFLPSGQHTLKLSLLDDVKVVVNSQRTTLVFVERIGQSSQINVVNL